MASGSFQVSTNGTGFVVMPSGGQWSTSNDPGNNRSLVSVSYSVQKNSASSATFGNGTFGISIDGVNYPVSKYLSAAGNAVTLVHSASAWITHNPNGSRQVAISVSGGIPGTSWTTTTGSTTATLDDYDRSPSWASISTPTPVIRGNSYSGFFSANAAGSYGIISGSLPDGLSLNTSNGEITGTTSANGSFNFTVRAYGAFEGSVDANRTIVVNPPAPVFTDASVSSTARINDFYADGVEASDATSYSLNSGSLPAGVSLNSVSGAITGSPNTAGTYNFTVRAFNVTGSVATGTLTIAVFSSAGVWNGTTFVSGRVKVWNGSSWKDTNDVRVWNGSSWVQAK